MPARYVPAQLHARPHPWIVANSVHINVRGVPIERFGTEQAARARQQFFERWQRGFDDFRAGLSQGFNRSQCGVFHLRIKLTPHQRLWF